MKKLLIASLLFATTQANAAVNLVENGSFETPDVATGEWAVFKKIDGWKTTGAGVEVRNNIAGKAFEGNKFIELDSHYAKHTNSSIFQFLDTEIGKRYDLSFMYSPRIQTSAATNGISVYWNNVLLDTISANGGKTHQRSLHEYDVIGTGHDKLSFFAVGTDDSYGGSLDLVSVSPVPEPATALMFGAALGMFSFIGMRRKNQQA